MDPVFFCYEAGNETSAPATEVTFNPETPNLGSFQIYGSEDRYKTQAWAIL